MKEAGWLFIMVSLCLAVLISSFGLRLFERRPGNDYEHFTTNIWLSFITMTTVGYGDFYPSTQMGRFIAILASLYGVCLTSLFVISLNNVLSFQSNERKAYMLL